VISRLAADHAVIKNGVTAEPARADDIAFLCWTFCQKKADENRSDRNQPSSVLNTELICLLIDFFNLLGPPRPGWLHGWAELQRNHARPQESATLHSPDE
jgi:hypothetical protein